MEFQVESNRIFAVDDQNKIIAEITFPETEAGSVNINHTFVDEALRGQGIASKLVNAAYNEIKKQNKKAVLTCSYAVKWFKTHPECEDILN